MTAYKVLIVDDSKLARMSIAKALTNLHPEWTGVEATNAEEALALAKQSQFDIALLDFNMPGRDGLSLAADLRQMAPHMPVALISANVQQEIVRKAAVVGATFLAKPLTQVQLGDFLSGAVARLSEAPR